MTARTPSPPEAEGRVGGPLEQVGRGGAPRTVRPGVVLPTPTLPLEGGGGLRRLAAGLAALLLCACGAQAPPRALPATASPSPPGTAACGDPTAGLRPIGPLPAAGDMPAGSTMRAVQARGRLIAGVSGDRPLFGELDPLTNQLEGFEVDLLGRVARAIFGDADRLELRVITEEQAAPLLQQGAVDVVARGLAMTCAARRQVDFSTEYYHAVQRVLVARSSPARGLEDLRGQHVCAAGGSAALANVAAAPSRPVPVAAPDWTECLVRFQQGQVDAISADDATLLGFTLQDPYARIVGGPIAEAPYGLAVAQGRPDLVRFLDAVLEQMRADGGWTALYDRWLGRFGPAPPPPSARYGD